MHGRMSLIWYCEALRKVTGLDLNGLFTRFLKSRCEVFEVRLGVWMSRIGDDDGRWLSQHELDIACHQISDCLGIGFSSALERVSERKC